METLPTGTAALKKNFSSAVLSFHNALNPQKNHSGIHSSRSVWPHALLDGSQHDPRLEKQAQLYFNCLVEGSLDYAG
jgi:hypothetical protein